MGLTRWFCEEDELSALDADWLTMIALPTPLRGAGDNCRVATDGSDL
ncbi:MAG: hypothetical protein ACOH2M_18775 [Cypionkella sp.]